MSKTFKDHLNEVNSNEMLYVGTENGNNWIVIETAGNIDANIDKLEKLVHDRVLRTNRDAKAKLKKLPAQIVAVREDLEKCDPRDNRRRKSIESKICDLENSFVNTFNARKETDKRLSGWKHLYDRTVVETYQHETDIIGTCVILEGADNGTIWFKGEKKVI